jgi:DNA-binding NarL/FixJ family response regulator
MRLPRLQLLVFVLANVTACGSDGSGLGPAPPGRVPLTELGSGTYKGFGGGLYPGGGTVEPSAHAAVGQSRAQAVVPLDTTGTPSAGGKIVLLSLGMSNTTQEFCAGSSTTTNCSSWSFMGQAAADAAVNHTTLAIVNGARGGQDAQAWDAATDANYDTVRLNRLAPLGLTERQVQVVWVKQADAGPRDSLPSTQADAYGLESRLANITRALQAHYPNLKIVFFSSRIYAGYATTTLNPEPYAYESGFAVKWLIQAQIDQIANGGTVVDARAGDLNYNSGAPWLAWGPYLWADGTTPRQGDGLVWQSTDFVQDGTHPSQTGQQKVGTMLLTFFKTSPFTKCWFIVGGTCP